MKSANNELTTARNTPNPIVAAGEDNAPVPGTSPIAPTSNQGLAVNLCCDSHHAMMAPMGTRTNSIVMLTARVSLSGSCDRRLVLRHEILLSAWHAVIVSPAIDHWQLLAQLPCPGGVSGVCHSSVVALQGLLPAGLPLNRLQIRLNRNTIWAKPTVNAAMVMKTFRVVADGGMKAVSPSSKYRRGTPSRPR